MCGICGLVVPAGSPDPTLAERMNAALVHRGPDEGSVDVFNILNANPVLAQNEGIGTTIGRPSRILAPRIVRFGATVRF